MSALQEWIRKWARLRRDSKRQGGGDALQIKLNQLSKILTIMVLGICVLVFGVNIARSIMSGAGADSGLVLNTFMIAVSLAVAAIPEGLAAVVTILLSIGVTKMSKIMRLSES